MSNIQQDYIVKFHVEKADVPISKKYTVAMTMVITRETTGAQILTNMMQVCAQTFINDNGPDDTAHVEIDLVALVREASDTKIITLP